MRKNPGHAAVTGVILNSTFFGEVPFDQCTVAIVAFEYGFEDLPGVLDMLADRGLAAWHIQ